MDPEQREKLYTFISEVVPLPEDDQRVLPFYERTAPVVLHIHVKVWIEKKAA